MSGVARMGALTARTAVRSRQVLKTRGDAYWTHKGSTLSPLLLVCLHQSAFGTPRLALYKYTLPPVLYFHGRGEGGGWRAALRAQPQQLRCCTERVRALLRDVAPSAHVPQVGTFCTIMLADGCTACAGEGAHSGYGNKKVGKYVGCTPTQASKKAPLFASQDPRATRGLWRPRLNLPQPSQNTLSPISSLSQALAEPR